MNSDEPIKLTQYEALIAGYIQGNISYESLRYLASWLDNCQEYVKPDERSIYPNLLQNIVEVSSISGSKDAFDLYLLLNTIECTVTIESQKRILTWTSDYNNSAIALY